MKTNRQLLAIAEKQIGNGGSKYRNYVGASGNYCNMFVYWLFNANGCASLFALPSTPYYRTYCPDSIKWCRKNLAQIPLYLAMPCDIIYFDWEPNGAPNHIGVVEHRISTKTIKTIEGNTDKKDKDGKTVAHSVVAERTRAAHYVCGLFRPHFVPAGVKKKVLDPDGDFGYQSIYNLQLALGMKPTGILSKETVKYLQRRAGASPDGVWGEVTSRKVQAMTGAVQDGDFGENSVKALQRWVNKVNYPSSQKKPAETSVEAPATTTKQPTRSAPTGQAFTEKLPTPNTNAKIINGLAYRQCWPYGTPQNKYTYKKGKPLKAYTQGIDKAYPGHNKWPNKKQRVGACCDVFVGECLGNVGIKVPKDLKNQLTKMPKMKKQLKATKYYKTSQFDAGMVIQRGRKDKSGHTFVIAKVYKVDKKTGKVKATKYIANSHYKKLGGCYAVMDSKAKNQKPSKWKYYKCYIVQGAIRTYYQKGDYGLDVYRIQRFLKWAGFYKGTLGFDYNDATVKAVNAFRKAIGWQQTGKVGESLITEMRKYRR